MRNAHIFYKEFFAGVLTETDDGEYFFTYDANYVSNHPEQFITFTMPVTKEPYVSNRFFPFFEGLIPKGWLLDIASKNWKINPNSEIYYAIDNTYPVKFGEKYTSPLKFLKVISVYERKLLEMASQLAGN